MRIYYRTASVLVTEQVLHVRGRPPLRIDGFMDLYVVNVRGTETPQWTLRRTWPAIVAVPACIIVAVHDLVSGGEAPLLVPAVVLVVCAVILVVNGRNTDPVSELWAVTGSGHVCLFRSRDRQTFGQIRRAVLRAREGRQV
jgi:hypothetical protein